MEYKYINPEYLESVSSGDPGIIKEIVSMFGEQIREVSGQMNSLLENKDYLNLGLLAHKVKSSVSIMGMDDLASMLKTFEIQAKEGRQTEQYDGYIERFTLETAEAFKELQDLISTRYK
ncbi:MAG TPA: Hpt domain-containing protein [Bacteroidales bacterium]|jgi:HPt (histidine-containing phosphotransfer) domain-containing protein|nr:Hpt domain-containing protein [Bacteroidales bacterium]